MDKNPLLRKCLTVGISFLFVLTCLVPTTAQNIQKSSLPASSGLWLDVGGSGSNNYTTIQDAINNASNGDTVYVYNGVYNDHVDYYGVYIDKSINLVGENKHNTIIDATGNLIGINVFVGGVNVSGFTVKFATGGTGRGIEVDNLGFPFKNVNIYNNIITQNDNGFRNEVCENCMLYNNIITDNNERGIWEYGDMSTTYITNNEITNNPIGIEIGWNEKSTTIENNHFESNDNGILISLDGSCKIINNSFINNRVDSKIFYGPYYLGSFSLPLYKNKWDGNYWDNWEKTTPKPIISVFGLTLLIPFPGAHFIQIPLGVYPYFAFDWHPAQEPYDIPGMN